MAKSKAAQSEGKKCPLTKEEFTASAEPLEVKIGGMPVFASPKVFSSGSFGWYATAKIPVKVGDTLVNTQVGLNIIAIGSKPEGGE